MPGGQGQQQKRDPAEYFMAPKVRVLCGVVCLCVYMHVTVGVWLDGSTDVGGGRARDVAMHYGSTAPLITIPKIHTEHEVSEAQTTSVLLLPSITPPPHTHTRTITGAGPLRAAARGGVPGGGGDGPRHHALQQEQGGA